MLFRSPPSKQFAVKDLAEKAQGYGVPAVIVDGNDVIAVYEATRDAVARARAGEGVHFIEVKTYRRKGHAEHDDQSYQPMDEIERWATTNDPVDRYVQRLLTHEWVDEQDLKEIDAAVRDEVDQATDACLDDPLPEPDSALKDVYAHPPVAERLWYRSL